MSIFVYKALVFDRQHGENFDVMSMSFLDYNQQIREITITWNTVGRKSIWLAQFSGLTTEYSGSLREVLAQCQKHYVTNQWQDEPQQSEGDFSPKVQSNSNNKDT